MVEMTAETDSTFEKWTHSHYFSVQQRKGHKRNHQVQSICDAEGALYAEKQPVGDGYLLCCAMSLHRTYYFNLLVT